MTGNRHHVQRPAHQLLRCAGCGRLLQKATARRGPHNLLYGEECLPRAVAQAARPLIPAAYRPSCARLDDPEGCATPDDNVDWHEPSQLLLCATHRCRPK
jgi:hypothetical protein